MEQAYQQCVCPGERQRAAGSEIDYFPANCSELDPARQDRLPVAADFLTGVFTFANQARHCSTS
ncbi:hypothetical protein ACFOOK_28445 [Micromonospora krabiensis]|uniref:hypothetical protein n=1 Tax=Micromonospora krabiensis TaxID=307121 RepID=UPI003618AC41